MIKKIIIAEDHESANISLQKTLEELEIPRVDYEYYCDEAFTKIENAVKADQSYDLLITDLYFEKDYFTQKIAGGAALIAAARQIQPDLKVLVFSSESNPTVINNLFKKDDIDGFVRKARNDAKELKIALNALSANQRYLPRHLMDLIKHKNAHEFEEIDIMIVKLISEGVLLKNIPSCLQKKNIKPSSMSTVEKRLNLMKEKFEYSNNEQLILLCSKLGLI